MKAKVLNWAKRFNTFCFLDNHQYQVAPHTMECLLAAGEKRRLSCNAGNALNQLQDFADQNKGWLFGHLGYDLKNEIELLTSSHPDKTGFPDLFFFEPSIIIRFTEHDMYVEAENPEQIFKEINETPVIKSITLNKTEIKSKISKKEYITTIENLRMHILRGDCYEINYCHEFYAEQVVIDAVDIYQGLSKISPNPFSALYRADDKWLICASPERFLKKEGQKILSQPIKGTSKRELTDAKKDFNSRKELKDSEKDRSENVMVVDLVRNDLSKICKEGTVKVDELFGIYSFPQVHQMISTVSGELKEDITFTEMLQATFPMGSMTGAPKKRVMEIIEKYEVSKRGIFSGAVGYLSPDGNFDFNVVIRSILYNSSAAYISFPVGSGITFNSNPEKEWEECLMKVEAMRKVLSGND